MRRTFAFSNAKPKKSLSKPYHSLSKQLMRFGQYFGSDLAMFQLPANHLRRSFAIIYFIICTVPQPICSSSTSRRHCYICRSFEYPACPWMRRQAFIATSDKRGFHHLLIAASPVCGRRLSFNQSACKQISRSASTIASKSIS